MRTVRSIGVLHMGYPHGSHFFRKLLRHFFADKMLGEKQVDQNLERLLIQVILIKKFLDFVLEIFACEHFPNTPLTFNESSANVNNTARTTGTYDTKGDLMGSVILAHANLFEQNISIHMN